MDEEEIGSTEQDSLGLGALVIVHLEDESYETGLLMNAGENGLRLKVTHRVERVFPGLTLEEKVLVEDEVSKLNRAELILMSLKAGDVLAPTRKRGYLEDTAANIVTEALLDDKKPYDTLRPLTRTVSTFLPWSTVTKIVSFDEWHEEQTLRPLALGLADAEQIKKEVEALDGGVE